ncbi:MAG TPA: sigma-70 family RNA polymerase sigma factor, partial [Gemmataceae bacterium]|nr:sigma-70 family RNA polymerase sigma factor [Gemmataceae bacterium]
QQRLATDVAQWIEEARRGSTEALGRALDHCRAYLLLVANQDLPGDLRAKVGASDLVQQTFLEAQQDFAQFHGHSADELLAWLRQLLRNNLTNITRHYRDTDKRQVSREVSLTDTPAHDLLHALADDGASPSKNLQAREQDTAVRQAIERLPEPYRQVIEWRNYEELAFEEIGQRLERSAEAARKLWMRAIDQLSTLLEDPNRADT